MIGADDDEAGRTEAQAAEWRALPATVGYAIDGLIAVSLLLVLSAWGPAGTIAALVAGTLMLAGVIVFAVQRIEQRAVDRHTGRSLPASVAPAYVKVRAR